MGEFVLGAEFFDLRSQVGSLTGRSESPPWRARFGDIDPNKTVLFFAGITARIDAIHFEMLIGGERRDQLALAIVDVEFPAVVSALEILSVESTAVERHAAVRAGRSEEHTSELQSL